MTPPTSPPTPKPTQPAANWSALKAKLMGLDPAGLLGLLQALYAASKDNQAFLHTRFGLGDDVLKPYKASLDRWLCPDVFRNQDVSVSKAKKAIAAFKKAGGTTQGLAELMVYFSERAAWFSANVGMDNEVYLTALVNMFNEALNLVTALPAGQGDALLGRLQAVRTVCQNLGYGVGEDIEDLWARQGLPD